MSRFEKLHPLTQLLFFFVSLLLPIAFSHPVFSLISLLGGVLYAFVKNGKKAWKTLGFSVLVIAAVGAFNFLFAHYGVTVLFTIGVTDFTLEALFFGLHQGVLLSAVFLWFTYFGKMIDSERLLYLFCFTPKLALTFSMVLGFIPRFLKKTEEIRTARLALCGGKGGSTLKEKGKNALNDFSALVSYSLEAGMITADSMTARSYNPKAVSPKRFRMDTADVLWLLLLLAISVYLIIVRIRGGISFIYEPRLTFKRTDIAAVLAFSLTQTAISLMDLRENYQWKKSRVKA